MPNNSFTESDQFVKKTTIDSINSKTLTGTIREFNQDNSSRQRPSILKNINFFGFSLFKHFIVAWDEIGLIQRNGIPELVGPSEKYQRIKKVWSLWKPWTWFRAFRDNTSVDVYKISEITIIGAGNRHLINVSQGKYAKVIIDGESVLLDKGVHIIKTENFSYSGEVDQSESFIKHGNLYRLQVPSAEIAAFLTDNQPYLVDAGTYYIRSNNFKLVKPLTANSNQLFHHSADPVIQCGSLLRLMPQANTVAVYYQNGEQKIFPEDNENKEHSREKRINDANIKFASFLPTNLVNRHYPSNSVSAQFEYYTKDSVKVGVRLFVAYEISNPNLALKKLEPKEIDNHIEYVTHCDMAVAGQETSLQGIQNSHSLSKQSISAENDLVVSPPSYNQAISDWQHLVEKKLKTDLKEYGIDLIRLNIEEIKILDEEVEKKMSEQSYRVAGANADLAAVDMERQVFEQRALTESRVAQVKAEQEAQTQLINARTKKEIAEIEKETRIITAQAEAESLILAGRVFDENKTLANLEFAKIIVPAFKAADKLVISGPQANNPLLSLVSSSSLFSLPTALTNPLEQQHPNPQNVPTM